MKNWIPMFAAVALAAVSCAPRSGLAQPPATAPRSESQVATDGTARVYRDPDYVDVVVGVIIDEKTAGAAQLGATKVMNAVVQSINALSPTPPEHQAKGAEVASKLPGLQLQTGVVDLQPRYPSRGSDEETRKIIGYTAVQTIRIRTTDTRAVARILDAALSAGANRVESVNFQVERVLEAREEAIRLATKAAQRKAGVLADSLGLHLGRVISVSSSTGWWGGFSSRMGQYSNMASQMAGPVGGAPGGEGEDAYQPGKVEIWATVSLQHELVGK